MSVCVCVCDPARPLTIELDEVHGGEAERAALFRHLDELSWQVLHGGGGGLVGAPSGPNLFW